MKPAYRHGDAFPFQHRGCNVGVGDGGKQVGVLDVVKPPPRAVAVPDCLADCNLDSKSGVDYSEHVREAKRGLLRCQATARRRCQPAQANAPTFLRCKSRTTREWS